MSAAYKALALTIVVFGGIYLFTDEGPDFHPYVKDGRMLIISVTDVMKPNYQRLNRQRIAYLETLEQFLEDSGWQRQKFPLSDKERKQWNEPTNELFRTMAVKIFANLEDNYGYEVTLTYSQVSYSTCDFAGPFYDVRASSATPSKVGVVISYLLTQESHLQQLTLEGKC